MGALPWGRLAGAATLVMPLLLLPAFAGLTAQAKTADPPGAVSGSQAAVSTGGALELASVSPPVVQGNQPLTITGVLHNTGTTPMASPVVRVVARDDNLSREEVVEWARATGPAPGVEVGSTRLSTTIAPGAAAPFQVTVAGLARRGPATYGAVPLSVESGTAQVRTFAGYQRIKQYEPMSVAWAVPLTLDPDPNLFGPDGTGREAAWVQALGPQARVSRVLDATADAPVTWAVDPTLTPSLLRTGIETMHSGTTEQMVRDAIEGRIRDGASRHSPWVLPDTDADVGALTGGSVAEPLVHTLVARATPVAQALGGRADVAWPADSGSATILESALRSVYGRSLAAQVTSASGRQSGPGGTTASAAQRSTSGLPLLAYDNGLSSLLAHTTSPAEGVLSTQQFVAESAALLNELPGTHGRSIFVVAPRTFDPDPATTRAFFASIAAVPWLVPTTTASELAAARTAVPSSAAPVTRPADPTTLTPAPVLTPGRAVQLNQTIRTVHGVAQVREDGAQFARTWTRSAEQLASTRWRTSPLAWNTVIGRIAAATQQTTSAVKVAAGTINFLADTGRLQITVTNSLPVPVRDIKVLVEAANPRLRIDSQPPLVRIGAQSRATVNVSVTALAAGVVPLRTTLTTPDGTVIGQGANVEVHVTPTGDWVYWSLGALAVLVLLLGIVRSFTRRPHRHTRGHEAASSPGRADR